MQFFRNVAFSFKMLPKCQARGKSLQFSVNVLKKDVMIFITSDAEFYGYGFQAHLSFSRLRETI